jgi:hypothetical protein
MRALDGIPSAFHGQFRTGRVSSVNATRHTAQVEFKDIDEGFVSYDLQVLATRSGDYSLPAADTPVLCVLIDGRLGVGFVLGAIYTESDAAPLDDAGHRSIAGDDVRLGDPEADDKVSLAPKCNANFDAFWNLVNQFFGSGATIINEAGLGAPSALQAAIIIAVTALVTAQSLPPVDVAAENVSAK